MQWEGPTRDKRTIGQSNNRNGNGKGNEMEHGNSFGAGAGHLRAGRFMLFTQQWLSGLNGYHHIMHGWTSSMHLTRLLLLGPRGRLFN